MENINSWKDNQWSNIEKTVFRLQLRIYKAATNQKFEKMYKIQKLLISSQSAKYLSIKRVTQKNAKISICKTRVKQILVYLALCPQWEVNFESESYGFRPSRSILEAVEAIRLETFKTPKWLVNTKILKSFDQLNTDYLLEKCNTFPELYQQIQLWLKEGIFASFSDPLFSLLVNIGLHGLGEYMYTSIETFNEYSFNNLKSIYYATNLVIIHPNKKVLQKFKDVILDFLEPIGLELNLKKTQIINTLSPGFIFLGFNIVQRIKFKKQQKLVRKPESNLQYITIITPSKDNLKKYKKQIRNHIQHYRGATQERLIQKLNLVIKNWALAQCNYISNQTFQALDQFMFLHLWKWVKRRHPMMSNYKLKKKYWHRVRKKNWVFGIKTNGKITLPLKVHSKIPIRVLK